MTNSMSINNAQLDPTTWTMGEAIAHFRKAAGLSQAGLAKAVGLRRETISRIERPCSNPRLKTWWLIMQLFGWPISIELKNAPRQPGARILVACKERKA